MSLDSVQLSESSSVVDGLEQMMTAAIGEHAYRLRHVDVQLALLVIEAARRAEDRVEWFPRGKWATIQSLEANTEKQLRNLFKEDT